MDSDRWTIVQKKSVIHRLPAARFSSHVDSVEAHSSARDDRPDFGGSSLLSRRDKCADQTDISSLIGAPFIVPCHVTEQIKPDLSPEADSKINSGQFTTGHVGGLLRIKVSSESDVQSDKAKVQDFDFEQVNDVDWPSISGGQKITTEDECEDTEYNDGKSWSTVLKTLPQVVPVGESKGAARKDEKSIDEAGDKSLTKKKKKKKESSQSSTSVEKRRDQPLLLEFESLFNSLQVQQSKKIFASGGAPVLVSRSAAKRDVHLKQAVRSGNILDSSAPATRRGKERETPKKKRPSALRKVITTEKEIKKTGGTVESKGTALPSSDSVEKGTTVSATAKPAIHNRRFRDYCTHVVTEEINSCAERLLSDLVRFQDRMYLKDPIKAKAKRRYVCGLREVLKHLKLRRLKCVLIPPNLDSIKSEGGINDVVHQIIDLCFEQQLPAIFAMSRRRLALVLKKRHKVGCVGIFSYDGAEVHYKLLMTLTEIAHAEYDAKLSILNTNGEVSAERKNETSEQDRDEAGITSGSSSESDNSGDELCDESEECILSTPWRIFFDKSQHHNQGMIHGESAALNVNASEFVPSFKLNVDAKEFIPFV